MKKILHKKSFIIIFLFLLALGLFAISAKIEKDRVLSQNLQIQKQQEVAQGTPTSQPDVLGSGRYYQSPQIYISGGENSYSAGGMIALASTDESAIYIGGYNITGVAEVGVYEANEDSLLDYLQHDKDGKQIKKTQDVSKFNYVTTIKQSLDTGSSSQGVKLTLPLKETGIWYLKVKIAGKDVDAFVLRSNFGVLTKEGDNEFIFWGQDYKTKRSVSDGVIKLYNMQDGKKELQTVSFTAEGLAKANLTSDADIAVVTRNDDRVVIPLNLKYLNTGYANKDFQSKVRRTRYFIFTDRPLYKPGDQVFFKAVLRDDDDVAYTIPSGEATVKAYEGYFYEYEGAPKLQPFFEKTVSITPDGTISGDFKLPPAGKVGQYTLVVNVPNQSGKTSYWDSEYSSSQISFDVEYFKKPEFSIDITTPKRELIAKDNTSFTIKGEYFSGQPLAGQKVKFAVQSGNFYEYQYLADRMSLPEESSYDYRYGYFYDSKEVMTGTVTLDQKGEAVTDLKALIPPENRGKTQVFIVSATFDDGSITPSYARKNILVYAGDFGIYRSDYSYGTKINTPLSLPVKLVVFRSGAKISNINLTAKIHRDNWVSFQETGKKDLSYKKEEEDLPSISAKTSSDGSATLSFTPTKLGSYKISVEGTDSKGNPILKEFYSYVTDYDYPSYTDQGNNELTISTDKQKYQPSDTVKFTIFSQMPNRDVFLSLERARVNRYQVVHIDGKTKTVEVPLETTDIPNMFARVSSFSNYTLDSNETNIKVSSDSKKLVVNVTPNSKTYGPGETVNLNVSTTDTGGNPVAADVAVWAVDKAIFELSDNKLGDIFDTFWHERYNSTQEAHSLEGILVQMAEGGGCFAAGTKVLMQDGSLKNIEEIKVGDYILTRNEKDPKLVKAKVLNTHSAEVGGYLIINSNLRVTENHIMRVNNTWKEAGSIQGGDKLIDTSGKEVMVESIEWQMGKFSVYNLEIEKSHTYFANGIWVHNQKGAPRQIFKDTAYWNPVVHTDASGRAKVSFKLPDNLTTWAIAAVGATSDTKVGQTTNEIVVTKDVVVRPILPNILRVGDEIYLSALVQNFTNQDQVFDIGLEFDSGNVEGGKLSNVSIKSNSMEQFSFKVLPKKESAKGKLTFSARSQSDKDASDVVVQEIPVKEFAFEENTAAFAEGAKTFSINLNSDSNLDKSKITLSLSPTILGSLPSGMKYLLNYPYGCVEQTTSRFVPAVIALANKDIFAEALKDKDMNGIIEKGLSRLTSLQQGNGGWAWWYSGESDPFITSYVVEYLLAAKKIGIKVDDDLLKNAQNYLEKTTYYDIQLKGEKSYEKEDIIVKSYALTLLGSTKIQKFNLNNLTPDMLSLAVMTNYLRGDKNPQTNGLSQLYSLAKTQGDSIFWDGGSKTRFGSKDASTALAIKAIVLAGGDRNLAVKGARYLMASRHSDYWSNTYATAQVIQALTDLSKNGDELDPNYTYSVYLDNKEISKGLVVSSKQLIPEIVVPAKSIKSDGSNLSISKSGDGQVYSTLVIQEIRTDKKAKAIDRGLVVKKEFINEKGEEYSLAVGDSAVVRITVAGLKNDENYGVISDELPSGLVPINPLFRNEQFGYDVSKYYTSYDVTDREVTENGMVMSLYQMAPVQRTYTYRARVVSEGVFIVPPASALLMYTPEVSGRSGVQSLTITKESKFTPLKAPQQVASQNKNRIIGVSIVLVVILILVFKNNSSIREKIKKLFRRSDNSEPPAQTPQS